MVPLVAPPLLPPAAVVPAPAVVAPPLPAAVVAPPPAAAVVAPPPAAAVVAVVDSSSSPQAAMPSAATTARPRARTRQDRVFPIASPSRCANAWRRTL